MDELYCLLKKHILKCRYHIQICVFICRSLMETKLKTGTRLIVDLYSYSGVAFSAAKGLVIQWCKAPEIGLLAPDLVAYLDISPEKASERGVAESYKALHDVSWKVVDVCQPIEDVEKMLQEIVTDCVTECQNGFHLVVSINLYTCPRSHIWTYMPHNKTHLCLILGYYIMDLDMMDKKLKKK
ncbi:putative dTMP kinase [Lupinus albus]|uniref:Putative dTMP kinase n=1 Tax=Lupinus albus TaxID=3870 RepID=A0A6A4R9A7_LUPAL|nr:putative dTMP kinase [Lupinus albus]